MNASLPVRLVACVALIGGLVAFGDTVETTGGARITGRITKIDAGSVVVDTDYAGTITITQSAVTRITTDEPVAMRLADGTRIDGRITSTADGNLEIAGTSGMLRSPVTGLASTWRAGDPDPQAGRWTYEASADITGKTGNREQIGTSGAFRAVRRAMSDTLQFYAGYDRQITDHQRAADQLRAGIDYQNNFAGRTSWYARDEGGFDRVKGIHFYNVAAAGLGFDVFREPKHILTARVGISYRHESYRNPAVPDLGAAGLDLGLNHELTLSDSRLVNRVAFVPSFEDFTDYRLNHESFYELPLAKSAWKLRSGVSTDYNSRPGPGVERLDTTYFSRLVLTWQ